MHKPTCVDSNPSRGQSAYEMDRTQSDPPLTGKRRAGALTSAIVAFACVAAVTSVIVVVLYVLAQNGRCFVFTSSLFSVCFLLTVLRENTDTGAGARAHTQTHARMHVHMHARTRVQTHTQHTPSTHTRTHLSCLSSLSCSSSSKRTSFSVFFSLSYSSSFCASLSYSSVLINYSFMATLSYVIISLLE